MVARISLLTATVAFAQTLLAHASFSPYNNKACYTQTVTVTMYNSVPSQTVSSPMSIVSPPETMSSEQPAYTPSSYSSEPYSATESVKSVETLSTPSAYVYSEPVSYSTPEASSTLPGPIVSPPEVTTSSEAYYVPSSIESSISLPTTEVPYSPPPLPSSSSISSASSSSVSPFASAPVVSKTASNAAAPSGKSSYTCSNNQLKCCNSLEKADSPKVQSLLQGAPVLGGLIGALIGADLDLGLECTDLNVIGVGTSGSKCNQQTVCCENNSFNGLINIACTPINIQLI